jgi:type IX secretion system PorP/SprF family membrane protein
MKRVVIAAIFACGALAGSAQQDPQLTQWMYDKLSVNPGVAGTDGAYCLNGFFREQWSGFAQNPSTVLMNFHGPVKAVRGGLGLSFFSDNLGQETNTAVRLSYSYHLGLSNGSKLGLGLGFGYLGKKLGNDWLPPQGIESIALDDAIDENAVSQGGLDLSFGAYWFKADKYYLGLSSTHLTGQDLDELRMQVARHYYVMGGITYPVNDMIKLRPNLLVKTDAQEAIIDLNVNALINNMFWVGLTYRTEDAIAPMLGFQYSFNNEDETAPQTVRIGYSYDATTSELRNYSSGSHEIMLTYCFNIIEKLMKKSHGNPRFL